LTFFNKDEFQQAVTLKKANILVAEKILDLLLCYGMSHRPIFSESFIAAIKELEQAKGNMKGAIFKKNFDPEWVKVSAQMRLEKTNANALKKTLYPTLAKTISKTIYWVKHAKEEQNVEQSILVDYLLSVEHLNKNAVAAMGGIKKEKENL